MADIEDFATQLRELKERSGRSYGTLAARLHVSTSTLHRYCNGAAVPGDYAPVERFARLCGATPEELLALHRRWLLADAVRRREPARVPPARVGASAREVDEPPAVTPEPLPAPPMPAASRRRLPATRRSRLTLAGLAAVAAIAAVLPLTLRPWHSAADPRASAPMQTSLGPTVDSGPPPVQVSVLSDNWDTQCDQWFWLKQSPGKVPPPPSLQETNGWASALGAQPAGALRLQLTAQSLPGQPVVLHVLYIRVVSSRPAPEGIGYTTGSGCGGGLQPAAFDVDLDASAPRAKAVPGTVGNGETATVSTFPYQISASEAQVLDVDAHTKDQDVSWYLELLWSRGDRHGTLRVDDHGKPFRTIGLKGDPAYFYNGSAWERTPGPSE